MNIIDRLIKSYFLILQFLQHWFLLALRLYFGYRFILTGWGKLENFDRTVGFFTKLGLPFPEINVVLAGGTELVGGALILIGLFTRLASFPLCFTMIVAYLTAHSTAFFGFFQKPNEFFTQAPFPFLFACLVLMFFGAGKISLDYLLKDRKVARLLN